MKNLFLLALLFCASLSLAQENFEVNSKIDKATVFLNGAQVTRSATLTLAAGNHNLVFPYLPQELQANSVQFKSDKQLAIISISTRNNFLSEENLPERLVKLQDRLEELSRELQLISAGEESLTAEQNMILANQKIGGEQAVLNVQQLSQVASFFSRRIKEIKLELIELAGKKKKLSEERNRVQRQLQEERQAFNKLTSQVWVNVEVPRTTNFRFDLTYQVSSVSWYSTYDARVNELDQPVELTHKAVINQQSGEDWNDVDLTLATGNPTQGAQVPYMNPWYVNFNNSEYYLDIRGSRGSVDTRNANVAFEADAVQIAEPGATYPQFNVSQNLTQQEYTVNRRQNIASSTSPATVVLRELQLPAKYEYHAKPRLDKDAFLIAKVYNWEQFDLLPGEVSLFNNNTYVGKAALNTANPDDTLQLSLGRDQNVVVERTRIYSKQEKSLFGTKKTDNYTWKIEVRNTKKSSINLVLRDQIPVSQNEDIEVKVNELSGGKLEPKSGIIKWRLSLPPSEKKTQVISYQITYPKNQSIYFQ